MAAPLLKRVHRPLVNLISNAREFSVGGIFYAKRKTNKAKTKGKSFTIKRTDGQFVHKGEILVTQSRAYLRYYPGENVGLDNINRLFALCDGEIIVSCEKLNPFPDSPLYRHVQKGYVMKKKFFNIIPTPLHGKFKLVSEV